jgi:hypothetical protein
MHSPSRGTPLFRRMGAHAVRVGAAGGFALIPIQASAHVKWFCSTVDVVRPPADLGVVLTPVFGLMGCGFLLLVFTGFLLDGAAARRWPRLASSGDRHAGLEEKLLRLAVGAYFLLLWDKGAPVPWQDGSAILTPELMSGAAWTGVLQFGIAVAIAGRRTCLLAAAGICILYGYGIARFGVFHMTDYVFFPGIAAYLALTAFRAPGVLRFRVPLLSGGLAFGLAWTAVEKFVYPEWTLFVVAEHPGLAFGFPWDFTVLGAGFVEFTLAFYVMAGRGLVRFGAAGFATIFLAAVPEFGHLDAVGHLPIVGILAVVGLRGASPLQRLLRVSGHGAVVDAAAISGLYAVALTGFVGMYYGLHWAEYG